MMVSGLSFEAVIVGNCVVRRAQVLYRRLDVVLGRRRMNGR